MEFIFENTDIVSLENKDIKSLVIKTSKNKVKTFCLCLYLRANKRYERFNNWGACNCGINVRKFTSLLNYPITQIVYRGHTYYFANIPNVKRTFFGQLIIEYSEKDEKIARI